MAVKPRGAFNQALLAVPAAPTSMVMPQAYVPPAAPAVLNAGGHGGAGLVSTLNEHLVKASGNTYEITPKDIYYDTTEKAVTHGAKTLAGKIGAAVGKVAPAFEASAKVFGGVHGSVLNDMLIPMTAHAETGNTGATGVNDPNLQPPTFQPNDTALVRKLQGARAYGGPVTAGGAYLVGEQGPEVVIPQQDAVVLPNPRTMLAAAAPAPASPGILQGIINTITQPVPAGTPVNQGTRRRRNG